MGNILNLITPSLDFKEDYFRIGDAFARIMVINSYPSNIKAYWLNKISNIQGVIYSLYYFPLKSEEYATEILKKIEELKLKFKISSSKYKMQQEIDEAENILANLEKNNENIFNVYVIFMVTANNLEELEIRTRKLQAVLASQKMRLITAMYTQQSGFLSLAPYAECHKEIQQISEIHMPSITAAAAFPFVNSGIKEKSGFIIGKDKDEEIVLLNSWAEGSDRINFNWTILGASGSGKSTFVKRLMLMEWLQGIKQLVIDPERDYRQICTKLGGSWINCCGCDGKINPFQIRVNSEEKGALASHFQKLKIFFSLYWGSTFNIEEQTRLEKVLEELYFSKGIKWNMNPKDFNNNQYPIMSDLYELLEKKSKNDKQYEKLKELLRSAAIGADSIILNGITNVENNSDFIVLDTYALKEASLGLKRAQYFNIITWCWDIVAANLKEKISLNVDEAYLIVDKQVPQALQELRNISKKIRKYNGSLKVISHSVIDFLDTEVVRYGQSLLDNACYKMLMNTDGKSLEELSKVMALSEKEEELLSDKKIGQGLLIAGNRHIQTILELAEYEIDIF